MRTLFLSALLLTGCASLPTQTVNGVAVHVRPATEVAQFCYGRVDAETRSQPHLYGCYARGERIILVEEGQPAVLAHELRHANGWEHRGPCHSSEAHPDGVKPDGTPCEWYR
jgi:hypothetical protein